MLRDAGMLDLFLEESRVGFVALSFLDCSCNQSDSAQSSYQNIDGQSNSLEYGRHKTDLSPMTSLHVHPNEAKKVCFIAENQEAKTRRSGFRRRQPPPSPSEKS